MEHKKGFTLIELLVVISIIALLLAILMPALGKAKEVARNVVCRTNIRSITTGFRMYSDSNDYKLIPYKNEGSMVLWLSHIADQLGDLDKIRYCPTTKINKNQPDFDKWQPNLLFGSAKETWIWNFNVSEYEYGSYGMNGFMYSYPAPGPEEFYWKTSAVASSSSVPLFTDCRWVDAWPNDTDTCPADFDISSGGNGGMQRFLMNRHGDELNIGFVDGHVEPVKLEMLWSLKWHKQFQTKGPQTRTDGTPIYKRGN